MAKTAIRAARRRRLLELLSTGLEATQEEIVARLAAEGYPATQATISRDLDDVGAVRRHREGRIVYALPETNGPPAGLARRIFGDLVRSVAVSGNLVVVRTYPGMASSLGAIIDQAGLPGLLGTVAGDDTVLVVADEATGGRALAHALGGLFS